MIFGFHLQNGEAPTLLQVTCFHNGTSSISDIYPGGNLTLAMDITVYGKINFKHLPSGILTTDNHYFPMRKSLWIATFNMLNYRKVSNCGALFRSPKLCKFRYKDMIAEGNILSAPQSFLVGVTFSPVFSLRFTKKKPANCDLFLPKFAPLQNCWCRE